jgi:hypothetical protein
MVVVLVAELGLAGGLIGYGHAFIRAASPTHGAISGCFTASTCVGLAWPATKDVSSETGPGRPDSGFFMARFIDSG